MARHRRATTAVLAAVLAAASSPRAQTVPVLRGVERGPPAEPPAPPLGYALASAGLEEPGMEGGRTELELVDVDADGFVDLVSIGDHGSPFVNSQEAGIMVWFGDGGTSWTFTKTGNFGYGGVALGDLDGDGLMDAAYGMHHDYGSGDFGDQLLEAALGDGTGTSWTPWDDGLGLDGQTWGMFGTDMGDVDADGDLDVGSNSFGCCDGVHVYRNEGDGTWTHLIGLLGGNSSTDFHFCDVDGDGHLDACASNSVATVLRGDGVGGFAVADGDLPADWNDNHVGDVDGDGTDEVLFVGAGGNLEVWSWGPGDDWSPLSDGLPTSSPFQCAQLADMDGDGARDVLALGGGQLAVFLGDGAGGWTLGWQGTTPGPGTPFGEALRAADVDHNGRPDVVLMQDETTGFFSSQNHLYAYVETSRPAFTSVRAVEPGPGRVWRGGQARFVRWASSVPGGALGSVTIELSVNGPDGPWTTLVAATPDNGRAQIVVPAGVAADDARLRLVLDVAGDVATTVGPSFGIVP